MSFIIKSIYDGKSLIVLIGIRIPVKHHVIRSADDILQMIVQADLSTSDALGALGKRVRLAVACLLRELHGAQEVLGAVGVVAVARLEVAQLLVCAALSVLVVEVIRQLELLLDLHLRSLRVLGLCAVADGPQRAYGHRLSSRGGKHRGLVQRKLLVGCGLVFPPQRTPGLP